MKYTAPQAGSREVAAEVRAEMARQRLSSQDLAEQINFTTSTLHRRLTGQVPFDMEELFLVANALGVYPSQFFTGYRSPLDSSVEVSAS